MCYSTVGERKCGTVNLGTGNVVQFSWGEQMWYSTVGERKCVTVMLGTRNVVQ
jgi:hypothetical protein